MAGDRMKGPCEMRFLSLEELHGELLHIAANQRPSNPEVHKILNQVRQELDKRKEWNIPGMQEDQYPLSSWWTGYPGLGTYIPE